MSNTKSTIKSLEAVNYNKIYGATLSETSYVPETIDVSAAKSENSSPFQIQIGAGTGYKREAEGLQTEEAVTLPDANTLPKTEHRKTFEDLINSLKDSSADVSLSDVKNTVLTELGDNMGISKKVHPLADDVSITGLLKW